MYGVVVLMKCDCVDVVWVVEVCDEIVVWLYDLMLVGVLIFEMCVMVVDDLGVVVLKWYLVDVVIVWCVCCDDGLFWFVVDCVFMFVGQGIVVMGIVFVGCVVIGDMFVIVCIGGVVCVCSIYVQNWLVEVGCVGECCVLNLVGVDKVDVEWGDIVVDVWFVVMLLCFDVELMLFVDVGLMLMYWVLLYVYFGMLYCVVYVVLFDGDMFVVGQWMCV